MNEITNDELKCKIALDALHNVIDPEIGLNVADLGLIYQMDFDETENKIYCTMTLTTQFCPMGKSISNAVANALEQTFEDYEANVKVIFNPPWNAEMISPEGHGFLNQ
jgi:metal-sulfur cluster biosynthetic enzyme